MCRLKYTWILSSLQRIPTTFGPIWWGATHKRWPYQSTATQRLSQASCTRSPRKPSGPRWYLWRRSWGHPEWCQRTPFYGGLVYTERVLRKHIHTHTHAHIAANTNKHADADRDRLGQRTPLPIPFLPTSWTGDVGRTHAEPTEYVQEAACAPSFQTRCSATVIGSCCMTLLSNGQKQQTFSSTAVWLNRTIKKPNVILLASKIWEQPQKSARIKNIHVELLFGWVCLFSVRVFYRTVWPEELRWCVCFYKESKLTHQSELLVRNVHETLLWYLEKAASFHLTWKRQMRR